MWHWAIEKGLGRAACGVATAALILGVAGCAAGEAPYRLPPPPSEADRAGFGRVELAVPGATDSDNMTPGASAEDLVGGGVAGAAMGGAYGLAGLALYGPPMVFGAVIFPPGAIIAAFVAAGTAGGLAAGFLSVPEDVLQEINSLVLAEWAEFGAASGARRRLAKAAEGIPDRPAAASNALMPGATVPDSVLTIRIARLGFEARARDYPKLQLTVSIEATLTGAGGEELHALKLTYESPYHEFSHWRADDGQVLRDELARAFDALGERVIDEMFLLWLPEPESRVQKARGG